MKPRYTIHKIRKDFPNDDACLDKILSLRYGDKPECPDCKKETKFHRIKRRRAYACQWCGHHVYPCAGTPLENSTTALTLWFYAMYLVVVTRNGVSAKELERQLGVTYKCAWRIGHKVRELMDLLGMRSKLSGHVEVDESYVGGKHKGGAHLARRAPSGSRKSASSTAESHGSCWQDPSQTLPSPRAAYLLPAVVAAS